MRPRGHLKLHPTSDKNSINNGHPKCIPQKMELFGIVSVCFPIVLRSCYKWSYCAAADVFLSYPDPGCVQ